VTETKLQELARAWRASGSVADEEDLLEARLQAKVISEEQLALGACLDVSPAAERLRPPGALPPHPDGSLLGHLLFLPEPGPRLLRQCPGALERVAFAAASQAIHPHLSDELSELWMAIGEATTDPTQERLEEVASLSEGLPRGGEWAEGKKVFCPLGEAEQHARASLWWSAQAVLRREGPDLSREEAAEQALRSSVGFQMLRSGVPSPRRAFEDICGFMLLHLRHCLSPWALGHGDPVQERVAERGEVTIRSTELGQ